LKVAMIGSRFDARRFDTDHIIEVNRRMSDFQREKLERTPFK